jgi:hypothetical protein
MEITAGQLARLRRAHTEMTTLLEQFGALRDASPEPEPKWKTDTARQWRLLNDVDKAGGDVGSDEWARLGAQHGYDPRGLGGYFRGSEQLMVAEQGARRVLTEHGRRFLDRWRADFG